MKPQLVFFLAFLFLFSLSEGLNPICDTQDHSSTLQVFHVFSPCSPFKPSKPLSWEESVLEMLAKDQARLQFLSSLAVARKSVVPIASGRQITQSPTYIVRAKIGTPAQTLLMAMDTSNDAAWVPCTGCVGCSSTVFNSAQSTTFKNLGCQAAQCKQVINFYFLWYISTIIKLMSTNPLEMLINTIHWHNYILVALELIIRPLQH